jgi:4-amino-4-deoxy-L-arabinose transferase-like glycosyltransferase
VTALRRSALRDLALLCAGAATLYGVALGARDLWHPNEPTYGRAVVEMAERGEWLVPTVNGLPFGEKPILYFWLARLAALSAGGVSELSLRLPSLGAGLAVVLSIYLLVAPYAGAGRARLAAALAGTTHLVFWSARQVQMDLLLCACTLAAVLVASRVLDHGLRPAGGFALAGIAAGLGCLAKGPLGLVCPALVLVPYLCATRRARTLVRPAALLGAACALVVGASWYALLAARGEMEVLREVLWRQNVVRFLEPWDHRSPWWYFLASFWVDMAPWSFFLPLACGLPADDEGERRLHRLAWVWIFATVAFFSLSASKRSPYVLPAAPAVAILVAALAARWREGRLSRPRRLAALGILGAWAALLAGGAGLLAAGGLDRFRDEPALWRPGVLTALVLAAGAVAILAGLAAPWRQRFAAACGLFGFVVAIDLVAAARVLPALDARKSHRPLGEAIARHVAAEAPLWGYRLWEWRASYSYYAGRSIRSLRSPAELREHWRRPQAEFFIVERGSLDEFLSTVGPAEPLAARAVGGNAAYLFGNHAATSAVAVGDQGSPAE